MSSNICGNCANFKPKQGEKFFNCTSARQGGIAYGMQVRPDTRACEAFTPLKARTPATPPTTPPKKVQAPPKERPLPAKVCPWGRVILIAAIVIVILLVVFGGIMCARNLTTSPAPTPTPEPTITATPTPIPTRPPASPTPVPVVYFSLGEFSTSSRMITVIDPIRTTNYRGTYTTVYAPPGTVFIICPVTMINLTGQDTMAYPTLFSMVDALGRRYQAAYYTGSNALLPQTQWKKGTTLSKIVAFVVPESTWGLELRFPNAFAQEASWKMPW